jgi:hypothetical protein
MDGGEARIGFFCAHDDTSERLGLAEDVSQREAQGLKPTRISFLDG